MCMLKISSVISSLPYFPIDFKVVKHMETFVIALKSNIDVVGALLIELDLDTPDRV